MNTVPIHQSGYRDAALFDIASAPMREALVAVSRRNGKVITCNEAAERLLGYGRGEIIGSGAELFLKDRDAFRHLAYRVLRGSRQGNLVREEVEILRRDGAVMQCDLRSIETDLLNGDRMYVVILRNMSGKEMPSSDGQFVQNLASCVYHREAANVMEFVIKELTSRFGWEFGELWIAPDGQKLKQLTSWSAGPPGGPIDGFRPADGEMEFPAGTDLPGRVYRERSPEFIADIARSGESMFLRAERAKIAGLRAWFGVPLVHAGEVIAVAIFSAGNASAFDQGKMARMRRICEPVAHIVKSQFAVIREREKRTAIFGAFVGHPLPIWICNTKDLEIRESNPMAEKLTGTARASQVGRCFTEYVQPEEVEELVRQIRLIDERRQLLGEFSILSADGGRERRRLRALKIGWNSHTGIILIADFPASIEPSVEPAVAHGREIAARFESLSRRERQVLEKLLTGATNKEIARELAISPRTVEVYRANVIRKTGVRSTKELYVVLTDVNQISGLIK